MSIPFFTEGDLCVTVSNGPGSCRLARECPHAFRRTNSFRYPEVCSFTRNDILICCPTVEASALTPDVHPLLPDNNDNENSPRISQLSEFRRIRNDTPNKLSFFCSFSSPECKEYGLLTKKVSPVAPLIPDPIFFEVTTSSNCHQITPLIVNGEKTRHGEFPHMAAIGYRTEESETLKFICGGVLISSQFVLTAAHCTNVFG